jgi:HEAT repeat protein
MMLLSILVVMATTLSDAGVRKADAQTPLIEALGNDDESGLAAQNKLQNLDRKTERQIIDRLLQDRGLASSPTASDQRELRLVDRALQVIAAFGNDFVEERHKIFVENLKSDSLHTRQGAAMGLIGLGLRKTDLPMITDSMRDPELHRLWLVGMSAAPKDWLAPFLEEALNDPNQEIRAIGARGLGSLKHKQALPALVALLRRSIAAGAPLPIDGRDAGEAIATLAHLKGTVFSERLESFPAGLKRVEQPEVWQKSAERVLDWWEKRGKRASTSP